MVLSQVSRVSTENQFDLMLDVFEEVFEDSDSYGKFKRPGTEYIQQLLSSEDFIPLIAMNQKGNAIGALAAYVLHKFEQERSEIYIYDLAVRSTSRRMGVATSLIDELRGIAKLIGSHVIFVQADKGAEDRPAQDLYRKLGTEEDVYHYDLRLKSD